MADHFLGALKEIERRAQNNILIFSDVLSERLDVIAKNMVLKPVSDNDYLKLLELYYKKFSKEENKQGMLFCLLRMQQIAYLKGHREKQNGIINLEYSEGYDSVTEAFLTRKRDYYKNTLKNIFQRFILMDTIAYVLLLVLFVIVFHISFKISFILLMISWTIALFFIKKKAVPYFYDTRIQALSKYVDSILLQIDQGIFYKVE